MQTCPECKTQLPEDENGCPVCGVLVTPSHCERHPDREAAARCVLCGTAVCADCESRSGRARLCEAHADVPVVEGWAQVYSTSTDMQAELIRENLQAEGIDSRILSQKDHFAFPVDLGDLSPVRVLVPAFDFLDAEHALQAHMDVNREVRFACSACGESYDEEATTCGACGAALR